MSKTKSIKASNVILTEEEAESLLSGGDDYANYLAARHFHNLLTSTDPKSPSAYKICHAFENNPNVIEGLEGFPVKKSGNNSFYKGTKKPAPNSIEMKDWQKLTDYFENKIKEYDEPEPSVAYRNIEQLGIKLHLDEIEVETLKFIYTIDDVYGLESFSNEFIDRDKSKLGALISRFLGRKDQVGRISSMFRPDSNLSRFGLIDFFDWEEEETTFPPLDENIKAFLHVPNLAPDTIVERMIGKPAVGDLEISDFSYLEDHILRIAKIIKKAQEKGTQGVNILLWGPAGAGKTELAKAIGKHLDVTLFAIGEDSENSQNEKSDMTSKQRLGQLFQAHAFLKETKDTLLFFDEIEDLLLKGTDSEKKSDTNSKIIVNRLLETNPIVTIWAGNDPEKFHESMRQRFSYSVYVDYPPMVMRKKIWVRQLDINDAKMDEPAITYLAREYMAPARMISNAVKLSASTGDVDVAEIERYLESSSRITYGDSQAIKSRGGVSAKFDPDLINFDVHQNEMGALVAAGQKVAPYALFLQGREGTGIRSFGRYLAEKAVLNQAEYSMRDIVGPNPFSSPEERLRKAFEAAHDARNLLIFSNMDLLASNPFSETSDWRMGLAPTFMKLLMDHKLPVIVHSYKTEAAFPAFIKDGFPIHLAVKPLTTEQQEKAYGIYFGDLEKPQTANFPAGLVPADFSAAAKIRAKSIGNHFTPTRIVELLQHQADNRIAETKGPGF